ncbi:MAG: transglutaminase family protein, partial [Rubrivivax sp.]
DVRLTMVGEPTFVATQERDAAEWNIDALGPTKRGLATGLVHKLREKYGQGGFLHFGQGKWYPGEQLPRWALSIFWRKDGQPVWQNPALFADERHIGKAASYTSADADRFTRTLAAKLGLSPRHITPGYEDTWYYLWRERRLPVNVDPLDSKLEEPMERERLRRVFMQGLDAVVGYVLPLKAREAATSAPRWTTGPWFFRDERMYLMPGDSPMGYRLPLDSVPWVSKTDYPHLMETDPFAPRDALAATSDMAARYSADVSADVIASAASGRMAAMPVAGPAAPVHNSATVLAQYMARLTRAAAPTVAARIAQYMPLTPAAAKAATAIAVTTAAPVAAPTLAQMIAADPAERLPALNESAAWLTRTALCVEVRDPGRANGPKA